ncbi:MAG: hypothetical protein MUF01_05765 [Bryobacterales bacterium]|jgi:hypothetical protein|nr:hypothetical protein [Bryobacterales bacterium]
MKSFQFPLEKVLAFRKQQWEAESAILATLLEQHHHFEAELEHAGEVLQQAAQDLCRQPALSSDGVHQHALAAESARRALRRLKLALDGVATKVARQRQVCLTARRDYELVRKLREARWAAWLLEVDREQESLATESFLARRTQRRLALSSRADSSAPNHAVSYAPEPPDAQNHAGTQDQPGAQDQPGTKDYTIKARR